jgi:prepilin-type processing-associated H-X9-DG protein
LDSGENSDEAATAGAAEANQEQTPAVKPPEPLAQPKPADAAPAGDPTLVVGGFVSHHAGGVNFAFGDGSVRFVPDTISMSVLQQLAHRADGKLLPKTPDF